MIKTLSYLYPWIIPYSVNLTNRTYCHFLTLCSKQIHLHRFVATRSWKYSIVSLLDEIYSISTQNKQISSMYLIYNRKMFTIFFFRSYTFGTVDDGRIYTNGILSTITTCITLVVVLCRLRYGLPVTNQILIKTKSHTYFTSLLYISFFVY